MASVQQIVSKGIYRQPQIENFVAVKDYIFFLQGRQKYLLLRLNNDGDFQINTLSFTVTQLDAAGTVLGQLHLSCPDLHINPGQTFVFTQALAVHDHCTDFRVTFDSVISGSYTYRVCNGLVNTYFDQAQEPLTPTTGDLPISPRQVQPLGLRRKGLILLYGIAVCLGVLVLCLLLLRHNSQEALDALPHAADQWLALRNGRHL